MRAGPVIAIVLAAVVVGHAAWAMSLLLAGSGRTTLAANVAVLAVETLLGLFAALLCASLGRTPAPPEGRFEPGHVDVLIPVRNDGDVLEATLEAAARMKDPGAGFTLIVVDDSDAPLAPEVARACDRAGVAYLRRPVRRGRKAGALNDALLGRSSPYVAVLDADHHPEPTFLVDALSRFAPGAAFVQTRVEWRNATGTLRRLAAMLQHQFYYGVQTEKGARGRTVWTGSGAVFKREALESVGGFPEDTLVEDFDLTLRLTNAGWEGRLSPTVGATGLLPWTAEDIARQLWRWSQGTTEVVRRRTKETLTASSSALAPRLELLADGHAYLASGMFVAAALLLAVMSFAGIPVVRPLGGWSLLFAPALVAAVHTASAWFALRLRGGGDFALLPLYHLVSLAFTPIVLAGALAGWFGMGARHEGRVAKRQADARTSGVFVGASFSVLLASACAGAMAFGDGTPAAKAWLAVLAVSFLTVPLLASPLARTDASVRRDHAEA